MVKVVTFGCRVAIEMYYEGRFQRKMKDSFILYEDEGQFYMKMTKSFKL